jgi:hypothetical protein
MSSTIWDYNAGVWSEGDIVGYSIEALDGEIGKVDKANQETGISYLIVSTGPWIFGKTVMLPAGVIERVDHANKLVVVSRSKEQIKDAPEYNEDRYQNETYRNELGGYYGPGGMGGVV